MGIFYKSYGYFSIFDFSDEVFQKRYMLKIVRNQVLDLGTSLTLKISFIMGGDKNFYIYIVFSLVI